MRVLSMNARLALAHLAALGDISLLGGGGRTIEREEPPTLSLDKDGTPVRVKRFPIGTGLCGGCGKTISKNKTSCKACSPEGKSE